MSWSRGSDSFTHPVTNYVTNQIVWNHPPGSDPDWDSFSWTREVSELDRDPELRWSRGSDSFTHPVTNSVTNRIVWNPPPGSYSDWDSSSWTREVSQLDRDHELSWSRGSDSFTHPVTNSVTNRIVWNPPPGSYSDWDSSSRTREVSQLDRDPELSWSRGSDSFTHPVTNSVTNRIVWKPPPGSNPDWDSSSWTREVSQLDRDPELRRSRGSDSFTHPVTKSVTNRIDWNPPPSLNPNWYSSSWTQEVSELDRDPELTRSRGSNSFTHPGWNPPPGSDPDWDSSSWTREVSQLDRDPPQILPCGEMDWVERWMKHYSSFQKILLVGEGDFSFSACLAVAFGCAHNIIATSLDSGGKTNKDSAS
ncbi:methyltransferase small domain protein, putative [Actinidia rufa]|uniref:Methyltransferase small domain protein, putative n=1 Tax=Actinidia rufa TaxID=165716 RepID=A0A7J0F613_9ERIC|nr:methyltransferase small domain protein, putative [Actinidia rufa]